MLNFETMNFLEKFYHKGSYINIEWRKILKLKDGSTVEKYSRSVVRLGVRYGKVIKSEGYSDSDTIWVLKDFVKKSSKDNDLLMCYPVGKTKSEYYQDGKRISFESISNSLYAKDMPKVNAPLTVFTLNCDNIIKIGALQVA